MAEDAEIEEMREAAHRRRRKRLARIGAGAAAVMALALGTLWVERVPIADHLIANALRTRGIAGQYEIVRIGPHTQRLDHLVLGNPARPDLTARWIEVDLAYGLTGVRVAEIRASGVRLRGSVHDGRLDLGDLSKFMGAGGGTKALPDIALRIDDGRATLATDQGPLALTLAGAGNLRSGFAGKLGLSAPRVALDGCTLDRLGAPLTLATDDGAVLLKGPLSADRIACKADGFAIDAPRLEVDLRGDPALDKLSAALSLSAPEARQGARRLTDLSGLLTAKGSGTELNGTIALEAATSTLGAFDSGALKFGGSFALRPAARDRAFSLAATLVAQGLAVADVRRLKGLPDRVTGTPLAPLAVRLAGAIEQASGANSLTLSGRLDGDGHVAKLLVNGMRFDAASGAHVALVPGGELRSDLSQGKWQMRGAMEMRGGGLPNLKAELVSKADGALAGRLTMADYEAGSARLSFAPIEISRSSDGAMALQTKVLLDGPLGDGAVTGLIVPLDARVTPGGKFQFVQDCAPLRWSSLRIGAAAFDSQKLDLCGLRTQALRVGPVMLAGRMGESPFGLGLESARYALASGRFDIAGLDARIGSGDSPVRLTAAALDGAPGGASALVGHLASGHAVIGPVPLDLTQIAGTWRFADGKLMLDGSLRLSDRQADRRFNPLIVPNAHFTLVDGRIDATGTLTHPGRKVPVATVTIRHALAKGVGRADFALDHLHFGGAIQPDDLTPLALGVIANVEGVVDGKGEIGWSSDGVTGSTGTFSTKDMAFAAAFGPVSGFATTLHFTDLLGMKSAPHQHLTVHQVSAGVDVFDGAIDYALLSNEQARIEGGRWPFSGGTLELLPATLDLDSRKPRHLAFRVIGLEAGAFINTMQLDNISATGTYDGLFPMVFDASGGRIDGGILVARQLGLPPLYLNRPDDPLPSCDPTRQAGDLSYVGGVSNAQLGTMGKLAFGALKNLQYKCLVIHLDGALDGEFVTRVAINGVNRGTDEARKSFIARPFLGLPFIFNVRIEAPFRGLMNSAASLTDPSALIRSELHRQAAPQNDTKLAVQPTDSDKSPEGNRK